MSFSKVTKISSKRTEYKYVFKPKAVIVKGVGYSYPKKFEKPAQEMLWKDYWE